MAHSSRAALAWLSAAVVYLGLEAVAAAVFRPSYSYAHNMISDLGVPAWSADAWVMNAAFCVQGALFLVGAVLAGGARPLVALVGANAAGNVLIALFHSGSATHAAGAVLAIVGGNAAVIAGSSLIGGWHRRVSIGLGVVGLLSFSVFVYGLENSGVGPRGVWERGSVYTITVWQLLTAAALFSRPPAGWPGRARRG